MLSPLCSPSMERMKCAGDTGAGSELLTGCHVEEGTCLFWLHPGVTGEQFQMGTSRA